METRYLTIALAFTLFIILLELAGYFYPAALDWGFHFIGFLPPVYLVLSLAVIITGTALVLRYDVHRILHRIQVFMERKPIPFLTATIALFISAATLFRVKAPLLGDSFYIIRHYADVSRGIAPLDPRNEPLATFIFYRLMKLGGVPGYNELLGAFFYGEIALGIIFIISAFLIVKYLFTDQQPRFLAFLLIVTLPYMQLFFGYIENYAIILVMLGIYIVTALLAYQEKLPFYALAVVLIVNFLVHYLTLLLVPSFLYLLYDFIRRKKIADVFIGVTFLVVSGVTLLYAVRWDYTMLLPASPHHHYLSAGNPNNPAERNTEAYTLFSSFHLIDLLNYAAMMTPAMIGLLCAQLIGKKYLFIGPRNREQKFMLIAFLPVMAFLLVVKFDLGSARDWDVFAPYFLILAVLTISMYAGSLSPAMEKLFLIIVFVSFINSIAMFSLNSTENAGIRRYHALFDKRNNSRYAYYTGYDYLAYYYLQVRNPMAVTDTWSDYINQCPDDRRGYQGLLISLREFKDPPESLATSTYERWLHSLPDDIEAKNQFVNYLTELGNNYFEAGYFSEAVIRYRRAIILDPSRANLFNNLGSVLAQEGKPKEALLFFERAIALEPNYASAYYNLGNAMADLREFDKARVCYSTAAQLGNPEAIKIIDENKPLDQSDETRSISNDSKSQVD